MAVCVRCGNAQVDGEGFCTKCGTALDGDSFQTRTFISSGPQTRSPKRDSRISSSSRSGGQFAPGELLGGRYRIVAMLGKGGMGEVYRADDLTLDQTVALKFLPEAVTHNEHALERFRNEVRIARQVSHPNVCRVYDLGEMEGLYYLSMEYIDGEDLGSLLRRIGRLPGDKALEISRKLCAGLAAAHEKGVLHRDLKPANVMLDARGQVRLTDFGLAGLAGEIDGGEVRNGTPAYMAPEQLTGEEVTVRSDVYALGLVIYEIFTGKLPFDSQTVTDRLRAQRENTPVNPSTLVRDLDPAIERVILRCLNPKPASRPVSALAVAAALPGGDPLAAALAVGETPSPEMVAAAGEGDGLSIRVAIPLLLTVFLALPVGLWLRSSALNILVPPYGPEVLAQKARDIAAQFGVTPRPFDQAYRFQWNNGLFEWFSSQPGRRDWSKVLAGNPQALQFEYRSHAAHLTGMMLHDDLMTSGLINWDDPPQEESGMIRLKLDAQGRLTYFERIPPQKQDSAGSSPAMNWSSVFAAAGLNQSEFQPAEPLWTSLATSDSRLAWTRNSPRPQRVEAASLRGQLVFFSLIEPWTKPDRQPGASESVAVTVTMSVLAVLLVVIIVAAVLLAVGNLRRQRGDRRGAFRLSAFVFCVHMARWVSAAHMNPTMGTFGTFLLSLATSVFYGAVMWTVYVALEPYVRRRWPQTLISWSAAWIGRLRDPVVGRDVLIGCAAGALLAALSGASEAWLRSQGGWPNLDTTIPLTSARGAFTVLFTAAPHAIREALFFFFLIFLLRALLKNQWIAGVAFALIFASLNLMESGHPIFNAFVSFLVLFALAFLVLRWGLLSSVAALLFMNATNVPGPQLSAWYFQSAALILVGAAAASFWAFHTSLGGRKLLSKDFLD